MLPPVTDIVLNLLKVSIITACYLVPRILNFSSEVSSSLRFSASSYFYSCYSLSFSVLNNFFINTSEGIVSSIPLTFTPFSLAIMSALNFKSFSLWVAVYPTNMKDLWSSKSAFILSLWLTPSILGFLITGALSDLAPTTTDLLLNWLLKNLSEFVPVNLSIYAITLFFAGTTTELVLACLNLDCRD